MRSISPQVSINTVVDESTTNRAEEYAVSAWYFVLSNQSLWPSPWDEIGSTTVAFFGGGASVPIRSLLSSHNDSSSRRGRRCPLAEKMRSRTTRASSFLPCSARNLGVSVSPHSSSAAPASMAATTKVTARHVKPPRDKAMARIRPVGQPMENVAISAPRPLVGKNSAYHADIAVEITVLRAQRTCTCSTSSGCGGRQGSE